MSELGLIAFIAKLVRNLFFDSPKKLQVNYDRVDPLKIVIKKAKSSDEKQTIFEQKDSKFTKERLDKINNSGSL